MKLGRLLLRLWRLAEAFGWRGSFRFVPHVCGVCWLWGRDHADDSLAVLKYVPCTRELSTITRLRIRIDGVSVESVLDFQGSMIVWRIKHGRKIPNIV